VKYTINKWINPKEDNRRGVKITAQCYTMVKIPCAEQGDKRTQMWNKGQGQTKRGVDYNTRTKNK
jgi:hypothetical protein